MELARASGVCIKRRIDRSIDLENYIEGKKFVVFEQIKNSNGRTWECKDCHELVAEQDTVAYHLVDKILYGWCALCFGNRHYAAKTAELAA